MTENVEFTSNEEMGGICPGDPTLEMIGFVDTIEGTKLVGKVAKKALYKFILNNGSGKRIRVLLWEQQAVKYEPLIQYKEIIRITRGKALPINSLYSTAKDENHVPFEISVQRNTTIELLGKYDTLPEKDLEETIEVSLEDSVSVAGVIRVAGYIKVEFCQNMAGNCTYGSGAIVDGIFKLRVQIARYKEDPKLREGVHVYVEGEVKRDKFDSPYIQVEDMEHIQIVDDRILLKADLKKGIHAPIFKRPCESCEDKENEISNKREKFGPS